MFDKLSASRKKGLLSSNLNTAIIIFLVVAVVFTTFFTISAITQESTPLNLRYSTTLGAYDRGDWGRVILLILFTVNSGVSSLVLASRTLKLKRPNLSTAILVVGLMIVLITTIIALQYVAYSRV